MKVWKTRLDELEIEEHDKYIMLRLIIVPVRKRRKGIGSFVLEELKKAAREKNKFLLVMLGTPPAALREFYGRNGLFQCYDPETFECYFYLPASIDMPCPICGKQMQRGLMTDNTYVLTCNTHKFLLYAKEWVLHKLIEERDDKDKILSGQI